MQTWRHMHNLNYQHCQATGNMHGKLVKSTGSWEKGCQRTSNDNSNSFYRPFTHTHTRLTALCLGLPRWADTRKVKPIWILLKQETVSGSGISWAIYKSAPRSRQITTQHPTTQFFTGRMPFLPPNQQRQSTEGMEAWPFQKPKSKATKWQLQRHNTLCTIQFQTKQEIQLLIPLLTY